MTMRLSGTVREIWRLKDNWVTSVTFLGSRDAIGHERKIEEGKEKEAGGGRERKRKRGRGKGRERGRRKGKEVKGKGTGNGKVKGKEKGEGKRVGAVSYTHLTLPTNREV